MIDPSHRDRSEVMLVLAAKSDRQDRTPKLSLAPSVQPRPPPPPPELPRSNLAPPQGLLRFLHSPGASEPFVLQSDGLRGSRLRCLPALRRAACARRPT